MLHQDSTPNVSSNVVASHTSSYQALLGTAIVWLEDSKGNLQRCRALRDDGSQVNIISTACTKRLGLERINTDDSITGVGSINAGTSAARANVKLFSCYDPTYTTSFSAHCLPQVTSDLPSLPAAEESWNHTNDLDLADPSFHQPGEIDLLIGVVIYNDLKLDGKRKGPSGTPMATETRLGWVLSGQLKSSKLVTASATINHALDDTLRRFWETEELPQKRHLTEEQKQAESSFVNTHYRHPTSGHFVVQLPFKNQPPNLGDSRNQALIRLHSVERSLEKSPEKRKQYVEFMDEYLRLGHMKEVSPVSSKQTYYLPNHAVIRAESTTTKLRVVFDASAKTTNGRSLNDELLVGPTIQDDLFTLLVRFGKHAVAFTSDICKMFRQALINPEHTPYQRILWRSSPKETVRVYELLTITYGTSSAPFLSTRCLQQLATDGKQQFPKASSVLASDLYVDDAVTGASSPQDAISLYNELTQLLESAGFELRKWASNSPELMATIPEEHHEKSGSLAFEEDAKVKTLGIRWSPSTDSFFFVVEPYTETFISKRNILSDVAKVFDPIGWLTPFTITAKILLQRLWLLALD